MTRWPRLRRWRRSSPAHPDGPALFTGGRRPGTGTASPVGVAAGRVVAVEQLPGSPTRTDLRGGWLIPGFIDLHVHLQFASPAAVLAGGVTTVRDLGGPPDAAAGAARQRGRGPLRIVLAGRILTAPGGYPGDSWGADGTAREVAGEQDGRAAVREQVRAGAGVIKVALQDGAGRQLLPEATVRAIVDEAARAGLHVTAHVGSRAAFALAVAAGVRELAHLPLYDVRPQELETAAAAGMVLVPTLAIRGPDPEAARAVAAFRAAGGTVVYGTDLGNARTTPGIMLDEVLALLGAGMSPADVLASATTTAADHLGIAAGRLQPGAAADLVVLGADPFSDPRAYADVRLVVAAGRVVLDRR